MRHLFAFALLPLAACAAQSPQAPLAAAGTGVVTNRSYDLAAQRAKIVRVPMTPDTSFLSAEEREVVNLLIQAADLMSEIYLRQVSEDNPRIRAEIAASDRADRDALLDMFDLHFGPWDSLAEKRPFYGNSPMPAGAAFYPADLTKAGFETYLAAHPDQRAALTNPYTVVRRQGDRLIAIPYSIHYKQWLEPAAQLLERAARVTSNASLKRFLALRAQAFRTDDYFASELAWMDLEGTPIEVAIGPYETYTDALYGQKTAFEAFVTLKNPQESAALHRYKRHLRAMEANLPVEDRYKNFKRGFASPIAVAEQVHGGGDNVPGVQTVAFNLPNDERVREAKGAKKVILSNVLAAKYARILRPMADRVLVATQAPQVNEKYMRLETLFHELSHSLGPGSITMDGRATTVSEELKEIYSESEEAKADVMGVYNLLFMMHRDELPAAEEPQLFASYVAGLFRAMRFGTDEAHGHGAAAQYGYLRRAGAILWDAREQRFRIEPAAMRSGVRALVAEIVRLHGNGDYAGTKAFFASNAVLDPEARTVIARLGDIPVDIQPLYPSRI